MYHTAPFKSNQSPKSFMKTKCRKFEFTYISSLLYLFSIITIGNLFFVYATTFSNHPSNNNLTLHNVADYYDRISGGELYQTIEIKGSVKNQKLTFPFLISSDSQEKLHLALSTTTEGVFYFDSSSNVCADPNTSLKEKNYDPICYDSQLEGPTDWCESNNTCSIYFLCNRCKKTSRDQAIPMQFEHFHMDGITLKDDRILGITNLTLNTSVGPLAYNFQPLYLITSFEKLETWPSISDLDGIWGIAGPEICLRGKSLWFDTLSQVHNRNFAIDSNIILPQQNLDDLETGSKAILNIGNFDSPYGKVIWSDRRQTGEIFTDASYRFTIYNFQMCQANLFGQDVSNWLAEIDTSSQCLVLPQQIYQNFISWAPIDKNSCINNKSNPNDPINNNSTLNDSTSNSSNSNNADHNISFQNDFYYPPICPLLDDKKTNLPVITFTLSDLSNELFHIPLEQLVYYDSNLQKDALCVIPETYIQKNNPEVKFSQNTIKFGLAVLNILYPILDFEQSRVGLSQKIPLSQGKEQEDQNCAPIQECLGQQTFEMSSNSCLDPPCSLYYFMTMNPITKECEIASYVLPMVLSIVAILCLSEFGIFFAYSRLVKIAASRSK